MASLAMLLTGTTAAAQATPAACRERLLPPSPRAATGQRAITAHDLIELRDFGRMDNGPSGRPIFALSQDGRHVAIAMRRADVDADSYCFGIAVVALDGSGTVSLVDVGGEFVSSVADIRGVPAIPSGVPVALAPLWSADGKALFYLRRDRGVTQVWRATLDGNPARPLTNFATDALSVEWARDGHTLLVATRPSLAAARIEIEREGRRGYHFDTRFWTLSESSPRPALPRPQQLSAVDPESGAERVLTAEAAAALRPPADPSRPKDAVLFAASARGSRAWTAPDDPRQIFAPARLHVEAGGVELDCPSELCGSRVAAIWWGSAGELYILRGGGPEEAGRVALYRWDVQQDDGPQLRFETDSALMGCTPWRDALLCGREAATEPRHLARVDLITGEATRLFNPNPEFVGIDLGPVERLAFANAQGMRSYGDLVLPPGHRLGQRHPLVVVQYTSRGFLRGGTGDDYPIYLLARHGFAVLSFQRPDSLPATDQALDINALQRINISGYAERRAIFSALDAGIDAAIARGVIDPARIGITGMSDGATTTQFALNNSTRFKVAAISSCCDEPGGLFVVGPAYRDAVLAWGYPKQATDGSAFWKPMSLSTNAPTMRTPLLIQVPDAEFRGALEAVSALEQHGAPVEMYVFPNENHVKAHPAHRFAVYGRAVGWFEFWLLGDVIDHSGLASEIARWRVMRANLRSGSGPPR